MEAISLPHLPDHPLRAGLFRDVHNAAFLRQQLLDGNQDFEYAFLDASVLLSRDHVLAACFRAINDMLHGRMKSRNVHSEIVFALSPNNNIAEAFRRFGISNDTKNLLAIKVGGNAAQIESHLKEHIQGQVLPFTDQELSQMCDFSRLRKIYRIDAAKQGEVDARAEAEVYLLGTMALKGS